MRQPTFLTLAVLCVFFCSSLLGPGINAKTPKSGQNEGKERLQEITREFEDKMQLEILELESRLAKIEAASESNALARELPFEFEARRGIPKRSFIDEFLSSVPLLSVLVAIAALVVSAVNQYKVQRLSQEHSLRLQKESRTGVRQLEAYQGLWKLLDTITTNYALSEPLTRSNDPIMVASPAVKTESLKSISKFYAAELFFVTPELREKLARIQEVIGEGEASRRTLENLVGEERELLEQQLVS